MEDIFRTFKINKTNMLPDIRLQVLDLTTCQRAYSYPTCLWGSPDETAVVCLFSRAPRMLHLTLWQVWAAARIKWKSSWEWETSPENCNYWRRKHVPVLPLGTTCVWSEEGLGEKAHRPFPPSCCVVHAGPTGQGLSAETWNAALIMF